MTPKRHFHGDCEFETEASAQESKRSKNSIRDFFGMFSLEDMVTKMEPLIRKVVREEAERTVLRVLQPSFKPSFNQPEKSTVRGFLLQFVNKPRSTIFTGSKIETQEANPIRIELRDANNKTIISSGFLSSMKFEILVLDADFGSDDKEDWSEHEFNSSIIREREGRRPLVTGGDLNVTLRAGVGFISDVVFTDNSSWQRSRKFRLGARPVPKTWSDQARIREARSEAFVVKDHRGESYKKHYPPCFNDEVWRLEKIAKDGASHKRLAERGIDTVGKFLQSYAINPSELRAVLGGGISNKIWDIIIEHASSCVLDDNKSYKYYEAGQRFGLLLNSVYKVEKATFDGQSFEPLDKLAAHQKVLVENLKRQAYANVNSFISTDAPPISAHLGPLPCLQTESFNPNLSMQQLEFAQQDPQELLLGFNTIESGISIGQNTHPMQMLPSILRNSFKLGDIYSQPYAGETSCCISSSQWPFATSSQPTHEEITQAQTSPWFSANNLIFSSGNDGNVDIISSYPRYDVHISRITKPKAGWCKLRAAVKLHSVKRDIALKRMWQIFT